MHRCYFRHINNIFENQPSILVFDAIGKSNKSKNSTGIS